MKKLFILFTLFLSFVVYAQEGSNYVLISSYSIAPGASVPELQQELLDYVRAEEERGFNACALYRHQFGAQRAFYTYCYFSDYHQFAEIMDRPVNASGSSNIGDHSDNIVSMVHDNLQGFPNYLMHVTNTFGPYLTNADRMDRANIFFDFYDSTFGGCDMLNHQWGPEIAVYFLCGFDNYHSFATAIDNIDPAQSEMMQTTRLDVVEHSDDILILIEK